MSDQFDPWHIVLNRRQSGAAYYVWTAKQRGDEASAELWSHINDQLLSIIDEIEDLERIEAKS